MPDKNLRAVIWLVKTNRRILTSEPVWLGSITSRCSGKEPALLPLDRTQESDRLFIVLYFPWDRRCRSLSPTGAILISWCERNWVEYKIPVGRDNGVKTVGWGGWSIFFRPLCPPPPLPTGVLYSPQFRSHQEIKMAARRTQPSTRDIYNLTEK